MRFGIFVGFLLLSEAAWGLSSGPPTKRTGAAVDGGLNCTVCHRTFAPANGDPRGMVMVEAASYQPGVRQTLRVTVFHPDANRWGFQLTARRGDDGTVQAGSFAAADRIRVRCGDDGTDAPCNGQLEFASHNSTSTRLGANGRMIFEVEWTPPAQDVGDIILYVAGNAADGTNNNLNDLIYTSRLLVRSAVGCTLNGPAIVTGVSNSASGRPGLAFNTLFSIYGENLMAVGRRRSTDTFDIVNGRFPTQLDCVAIEVDGARVPVIFSSSGQVNAQGPSVLSGPGAVTVIVNPGTSNERRVSGSSFPISDTQPAFFTFNGRSIAATFANSTQAVADAALVPGARPARAGEWITLYATGLGTTSPVWQSGEVAGGQAMVSSTVTVEIGGQAAEVLYAGLSPGSISGLYQVNTRVPMGVRAGDAAVTLRVGSAVTQTGTVIPIQ